MATVPEISQLIIEETLEWQKPLVDNLLIEWEEVVKDSINPFFSFGGL
jgi:hypothetical protein